MISADLRQTRDELRRLDDVHHEEGEYGAVQLSELQATTIREVYNECLKEAPKFTLNPTAVED